MRESIGNAKLGMSTEDDRGMQVILLCRYEDHISPAYMDVNCAKHAPRMARAGKRRSFKPLWKR